MLELAKAALDVGLFTNDVSTMLPFWQQRVGLPFGELLPVGGGIHQHRHHVGESVIKINHSREALPPAPLAGIRGLLIACEGVTEPEALTDPDGNRVTRVPPGHQGVTQLRVAMTVSDVGRHAAFYGGLLGLPEVAPNVFRCGVSEIALTAGAVTPDPVQRGAGYRYLTLQVFDVKASHAKVVAGGGREGMAPRKLGDVAHISFVRDPDGNWIEISQRKSLTGSLD